MTFDITDVQPVPSLICELWQTFYKIIFSLYVTQTLSYDFRKLGLYQGRSHGCARVCRCHPQWQLAHLKIDGE